MNKWVASDIPRALATRLASEYKEKNIPYIEIPGGLAGGSLQYVLVAAAGLMGSLSAYTKSIRIAK
jgi:hypothetical protein